MPGVGLSVRIVLFFFFFFTSMMHTCTHPAARGHVVPSRGTRCCRADVAGASAEGRGQEGGEWAGAGRGFREG
eukprot:5703714-Prymnesium_polylepis.1